MRASTTIPPVVVLVRPQLAENIGSVARAMANFGANELRLVTPRPFEHEQAKRTACDGEPILLAARTFASLSEALADCHLSIATTRRARRLKLAAADPAAAAARVRALPRGARPALVFGAESSGLSNDELYACDLVSSIPTAAFGSLNLGQAALLYLYEWFRGQGGITEGFAVRGRPATHGEKERVYRLIADLLTASGYQPRRRLGEFIRRVKLLFEERLPTEREQRILLKLFRSLENLTGSGS